MTTGIKKNTVTFFLSSVLLLLSCQTTVITVEGQNELEPDRVPELEDTYESVGLGVMELSDPLEPSCPTAVDRIVMTMDPVDSLIHFWIGGLYSTRTVSVYCLAE